MARVLGKLRMQEIPATPALGVVAINEWSASSTERAGYSHARHASDMAHDRQQVQRRPNNVRPWLTRPRPAPSIETVTSTPPAERAGAAFERLGAAVQSKLDPGATVRWNEKVNGRQIDATVRGRLGTASVLVIVECRDYAEPLGIDHVDALDSVRREVGANKAILVTRTGFTAPALDKAAAVGIDTCVLRPSEHDDHPGPGKPLRSIAITIQHIGTNITDLEVELVDGRRFPCGLFHQLEDADGNRAFLDLLIKQWLQKSWAN